MSKKMWDFVGVLMLLFFLLVIANVVDDQSGLSFALGAAFGYSFFRLIEWLRNN